jgi:hypothetical protein
MAYHGKPARRATQQIEAYVEEQTISAAAASSARSHSRIHSRNLSVFFPRPTPNQDDKVSVMVSSSLGGSCNGTIVRTSCRDRWNQVGGAGISARSHSRIHSRNLSVFFPRPTPNQDDKSTPNAQGDGVLVAGRVV